MIDRLLHIHLEPVARDQRRWQMLRTLTLGWLAAGALMLVDGLIWDAGVMWRPSRRTSLESYVGRRYGTMSYHGTFAYAPSSREMRSSSRVALP